jgi:hypothetical protein
MDTLQKRFEAIRTEQNTTLINWVISKANAGYTAEEIDNALETMMGGDDEIILTNMEHLQALTDVVSAFIGEQIDAQEQKASYTLKRLAYCYFANTVIALQDIGKLDLNTLDSIAEIYVEDSPDVSVDSETLTKDGRTVQQVCINVVVPDWKSSDTLTLNGSHDVEDEIRDKFQAISDYRWGW